MKNGPFIPFNQPTIDLRTLKTPQLLSESPKIDRAERRRRQRSAAKFEVKQTFTKQEWQAGVEAAYALGVELTLRAAQKVPGIGEKRLAQVKEQLLLLEAEEFKDFRPGGALHGKN